MFHKALLPLLFLIGLIFNNSNLKAQHFIERITNVFEFELGKEHEDTTIYRSKLVLAPVVIFEPITSFQFGIGGKFLFKPKGASPETRTSNIPLSATYTLRNQFIFGVDYTIFTNDEKFLIKGNSGFSNFPFSYFGVGNRTSEEDVLEVEINRFLFEPLVLRKIKGNLYFGGGLRFNAIWNAHLIEESEENSSTAALVDSLNNFSSGIEMAITFDSRDNVLNALHGKFVKFTHGVYGGALGSNNNFGLTKLNARAYYKLWDKRLDVLALEFFSRFSWQDVPLLELSSLGGSELLRGFQEQRFNDNHALFFQAEYRWQALSRLGFVAYTGVGDVFSNPREDLSFKNLKYTLGTGLRIKIVKSENLNIRLDYAFGLGPFRDNNFYLGIAEAF